MMTMVVIVKIMTMPNAMTAMSHGHQMMTMDHGHRLEMTTMMMTMVTFACFCRIFFLFLPAYGVCGFPFVCGRFEGSWGWFAG